MIEAFVFSALLFVAGCLMVRGAALIWWHVLSQIKQYRIVRR